MTFILVTDDGIDKSYLWERGWYRQAKSEVRILLGDRRDRKTNTKISVIIHPLKLRVHPAKQKNKFDE